MDRFEVSLVVVFVVIFALYPIRKGGIAAAYNDPTNLTVMAITAIVFYIIYSIYLHFFKKK